MYGPALRIFDVPLVTCVVFMNNGKLATANVPPLSLITILMTVRLAEPVA